MKSLYRLPLIAMCLSVAAHATVVVSGPFVGSLQEDFESQAPVFHVGSANVMGGALTLTSASNQVGIYQGGWGLGDKGSLNNSSPTFAFGNDGTSNAYSFVFTSAVSDFGGYWNTAWIGSTLDVAFYDVGNNLIGSDSWLTPNSNTLSWRGWSSTVGIARMDVLAGGTYSNESIAFDDLHANLAGRVRVPDSGSTLGLLGLVLVAVAAVRRKL
jgi:hypothetical protein